MFFYGFYQDKSPWDPPFGRVCLDFVPFASNMQTQETGIGSFWGCNFILRSRTFSRCFIPLEGHNLEWGARKIWVVSSSQKNTTSHHNKQYKNTSKIPNITIISLFFCVKSTIQKSWQQNFATEYLPQKRDLKVMVTAFHFPQPSILSAPLVAMAEEQLAEAEKLKVEGNRHHQEGTQRKRWCATENGAILERFGVVKYREWFGANPSRLSS